MGKGFKNGCSGGGNPLNFTVKAYPSETELKAATPKENTIGVITSTTISRWIFSATEPTALEPGMVCFNVGTSSDFEINALKKNAIQLYPVSAKQYVNSALTDVPCFIYVGGEWKDLAPKLYVYNAGDQCKDVTGGWTKVEGGGETISFDSTKITFDYGTSGGRSAAAYTVNKIDVSKYKTMVVTGKIINLDVSDDNQSLAFGLSTSKTAAEPSGWSSSKIYNTKGAFEETLDISSANSSYYVCLHAHGSDMEVYTVLLK